MDVRRVETNSVALLQRGAHTTDSGVAVRVHQRDDALAAVETQGRPVLGDSRDHSIGAAAFANFHEASTGDRHREVPMGHERPQCGGARAGQRRKPQLLRLEHAVDVERTQRPCGREIDVRQEGSREVTLERTGACVPHHRLLRRIGSQPAPKVSKLVQQPALGIHFVSRLPEPSCPDAGG